MRSQVESGAELLTRLNSKSSLYGLDSTLFFDGLRNTDIVEINGEQSTGKTLFLSNILAKCILPNVLQIKGCNASAILINTDHHFQISKLVEVMSNIINGGHTVSFASKTAETSFDKTAIIQDSLCNLRIIDCYNSEQFSLTLHTLEDVFLSNAGIALLAIDSISAYYWQDCGINTIATIDSHNKFTQNARSRQIYVHIGNSTNG
ncbi:X-ray repair cross complementing 2 [Megachile rotundata]|uniref:X-ray repair cross complementing 2 n=1 Tax=Megachile rotundata TaxID=143995 RepID=UPI000614FF07|nr:PREDICTED: DNA repair protein XRCC2 [Megachile rotundata]